MVIELISGIVNANQYTRAALMFFALFFLFRVFLSVAGKLLLRIVSKTSTDVDDIILKKSSVPFTVLSLLVALYFSFREMTFTEYTEGVIYEVLYTLMIISIGYIIFIVIDIGLVRIWRGLASKTKSNIDDTVGGLVHEILRVTLIVIIFIILLKVWGFEIGPLLAGLGIAGIAVALALQPTLSNIFSGIAIIIDGTFKVGDSVKVENDIGEVYKIGLRATRIKTVDNEMLIIPNSIIANSKVQNFLQPTPAIRVNVEFGVAYGVDPEYIKKIVIEEIQKIEFIDKNEEIRVLFVSMGESALNFKATFMVDDLSKKGPAHQEAISRIYRKLYKENIEIPFTQRTVWLREEGKVKPVSPDDEKFKSVRDKYYPSFGHEYKEEQKQEETKKERNRLSDRFSIFKKKK